MKYPYSIKDEILSFSTNVFDAQQLLNWPLLLEMIMKVTTRKSFCQRKVLGFLLNFIRVSF